MAVAEFRYVTTRVYQSGSTPNQIISELPFTGVNFTNQLNSNGTFQGHVLLSGINANVLNAYDGTVPGKTILWVLYTDQESYVSIPVWSGVIWARDWDSTTQTLSITAQEMMSLYQKRLISTTLDYSASFHDPAYIAYSVMQYAESLTHGKTGLTYNSNTTTYSTKKKYNGYELKNVYQAVKDLASNFFDFVITPYISGSNLINQFRIGSNAYPIGAKYSSTNPNSVVLQLPGNIIGYQFPEDASAANNKLYGEGYGANNTKLFAIAVDPAKIGYTGDWPLLEATANYIDVADTQLLKDLTLGQLNATSYPPTTIQVMLAPYVDPIYPTYTVGQEVRLDIQDDYFPAGLNGTIFRVMAISVNPGETGPSRVTLTLTRQLASGTVE
jgi:hypothetical protein